MPDGAGGIPQSEIVTKVVATGYSMVVGLSADRQITFQSGYEGDETDEAVAARMDRQLRLADRIKARYEIPKAEDDLAKQQETLDNLLVDRDRLDKKHELEQADRRVQLAEMEKLRPDERTKVAAAIEDQVLLIQDRKVRITEQGITLHQQQGKMGSFVAKGAVKADLDKQDHALAQLAKIREEALANFDKEFDSRVAALQAEFDKAEAERNFHRENQGISVERWGKAIADQEACLARLRASAGG